MPEEEEIFEITRSGECSETEKLENKTENIKAVPKWKIIASHFFALVTIIMLKFTYGFYSGFTTIIIPQLYKADAEIKITLNELTWFSSYCFMPPFGALLGGFLAQFIGCRMILVICEILYITSGLMFHWSTNAAILLSAQVIVGFVDGMQKGPCLTFFAEISLPKFRSSFMAFLASGMMLGIFTSTLLGTYLYWRILALVNVICPTIGLILIYFVPETPYWFASQNRYEDAKRSLAWFRGWTTPENVEIEMRSILNNSENPKKSSKNTEKNINSSSRRKWRLRKVIKPYLDRSFYIPLLTIIFIFAVNNFNGTWTLHVFSVFVFEEINSPIDPHVATIIFSAIRVFGSIACLLLINLAGKRKLLLITLPISGIFLTVAAVFGFLTTSGRLTSSVYGWIPTIFVYAALFFTTFGIDKISVLLNSEIFPLNLRYVGVGAGHFVNTMFLSLINKMYLYLVEAITVSGTLLLFAIVNIVGLVGTYFFIPDTEDKTLKEIEEHYAGTQSLIKSNSTLRNMRGKIRMVPDRT